MGKKSKRQKSRLAAATTTVSEVESPPSRASEREFNPDYSYVIKDLKRIGILAGTFFAVLIALAFILQ